MKSLTCAHGEGTLGQERCKKIDKEAECDQAEEKALVHLCCEAPHIRARAQQHILGLQPPVDHSVGVQVRTAA